ncbi:MAG: SDR family oxidoreductase [Streptosporangiaceae bacterium]|nr:SDR family oxidoreductase [Streptosporangiaceae bacterium]
MTGDKALALVTGANKGIGKETARQLARCGLAVLLGSRDPDRGRDAALDLAGDGVEVTPVQLDVTDMASVTTLEKRLRADHGRLDVLVNNAGVFVGASAAGTTAAHMRSVFETNVFGVVTLIHTLLPLLGQARAPRIVNVSSTTGSLALTAGGAGIPGDDSRRMAYCAAKAAVNMLTIHYAKAFAADPGLAHIKINSATPGYTATDMNDFQGTRTVAEAARVIVGLATLPDDGPSGGFFSDQGPVAW